LSLYPGGEARKPAPPGGAGGWRLQGIEFLEGRSMAAHRGDLGRQLPLRGPLKALEADIHHANAM